MPPGSLYDKIGIGYSCHRRPDHRIFAQIQAALSHCSTVVNVGAGAGSYEPVSCTLAVEPSHAMINQRPHGSAPCIRAAAESLPLKDATFDGSLASLTIHHWTDLAAGLMEIRRVTRKRIVLFTWDPHFPSNFWLMRDYLPAILTSDRQRFPALRRLEQFLPQMQTHPILVPADCEDGFMGAYWKRPEAYLDPAVRRTNSAFPELDPEILHTGLQQLAQDLTTGDWAHKNSTLEHLTELDLGYRLVISDLA